MPAGSAVLDEALRGDHAHAEAACGCGEGARGARRAAATDWPFPASPLDRPLRAASDTAFGSRLILGKQPARRFRLVRARSSTDELSLSTTASSLAHTTATGQLTTRQRGGCRRRQRLQGEERKSYSTRRKEGEEVRCSVCSKASERDRERGSRITENGGRERGEESVHRAPRRERDAAASRAAQAASAATSAAAPAATDHAAPPAAPEFCLLGAVTSAWVAVPDPLAPAPVPPRLVE